MVLACLDAPGASRTQVFVHLYIVGPESGDIWIIMRIPRAINCSSFVGSNACFERGDHGHNGNHG